MENWQQRTALLLGDKKMERLSHARVLVAGVGGVGSWAAEMLCRAGVGELWLVDADNVEPTNINRQLPALHSTVGQPKVEVMRSRLLDINPQLRLTAQCRFLDEADIKPLLDATHFDFVVDAIDSVGPKVALIRECWNHGYKIISSMGAGAKSDLSTIRCADLWQTNHCRLSKVVRRRLQDMRSVHALPVVYSTQRAIEQAVVPQPDAAPDQKHWTIGTLAPFTATFGCYLANYVIEKL